MCLQVRLIASFTDAQRSALLATACAVVYTPANEHFGIVPLEAMAAGRPVIACNSGGPTESIKDGKTGYLCSPRPAAFAAAMAKLLVWFCPAGDSKQNFLAHDIGEWSMGGIICAGTEQEEKCPQHGAAYGIMPQKCFMCVCRMGMLLPGWAAKPERMCRKHSPGRHSAQSSMTSYTE